MQSNVTISAPEHQQPRPWFVLPGRLSLSRVQWYRAGATVEGSVGDHHFSVDVETRTLLDRRSFVRHLWRFERALAILPEIDDFNAMIRAAEEAGRC